MFIVVTPTMAFCANRRPRRLLWGWGGVIPRQCERDREGSRMPLLELTFYSGEWGRSHQLLRWRRRTWPSQPLQVGSSARRLGFIANIMNILALTLMFCRNPDGDKMPWCFYRRGRKLFWDYCDVSECPEPTGLPQCFGKIPNCTRVLQADLTQCYLCH